MPHRSMLTELKLYCSWSDEKTLENILSGAPKLRSLNYWQWCNDGLANGQTAYWDLVKLGQSLGHALTCNSQIQIAANDTLYGNRRTSCLDGWTFWDPEQSVFITKIR